MPLLYLRSLPWHLDEDAHADPVLVEVRFLDEEAEEKAAARIAEVRERREAAQLDRARKDFVWTHCAHLRGGDCQTCNTAWKASPQHEADVAAAKAKAAAYHPLATTLGSRWRVPVGAAFAARVEPLLMVLEWPEPLTDGYQPELPALDLFVTGCGPDEALMSPLRPDGRYSGAANIVLPLDYLFAHGLRVS